MIAERIEIIKDKYNVNRVDGIEMSGNWYTVLNSPNLERRAVPSPSSRKRTTPDQPSIFTQPASKRINLEPTCDTRSITLSWSARQRTNQKENYDQ